MELTGIHAAVDADGHVHLDLPVRLPPGIEVELDVRLKRTSRPWGREAWLNHLRSVIGSVPDIERPDQGEIHDVDSI